MKNLTQIAALLTKKKKTLAIAESCTGGALGKMLTDISGSSAFFKLGVIAYSNEAKVSVLHVQPQLLKKYGAVSEQTAVSLAENIRKIGNTTFGLSITGIAGPTGATATKPVGLVYIALSTETDIICKEWLFKGNRTSVRRQAVQQAIHLLLKNLAS